MRPSFHNSRNSKITKLQNRQRGYILLTLLLLVALIIIAAAAIVPTISFELRRDREEELVHRGVQYSRAIRAYYKKFGRYPTRLEELESSNNLRFLRKRYKDPVSGQDFKLLHFGEVKMSFTGGLGGGSIPGANPLNGAGPGGLNGGLNGPGGLSQAGGFGGNGNFGAGAGPGASPSSIGSLLQNNQNQSAGSDPSSSSASTSSSAQTPGQAPDQSSSTQSGPGGSVSSGQLGGQTFGGGPIVGVVSVSKKESIREFDHKKKYEEWQFIYDPARDRGGLLNTPNQPPLKGFAQQQPLQNGQSNGNPPTTSGPIPGMMNNPNPGMEPNAPVPPPNPNPQQQ